MIRQKAPESAATAAQSSEQAPPAFVPLQTVQGMALAEFRAMVGARRLLIWGAGHLGKLLQRQFDRMAQPVRIQFCDANPALHDAKVNGKTVCSPEEALAACQNGQAYLLIANAAHLNAIKQRCSAHGLRENVHFSSYLRLARPEAVIQLVEPRTGAYLSLPHYCALLEKLLRELPHLIQVDLSTDGNAYLHPHLAEIVAFTEQRVASSVALPLTETQQFAAVIAAAPSQLVALIDGRILATNGQRALWMQGLTELATLARDSAAEVRVLFMRYAANPQDEIDALKTRCNELSLPWVMAYGYPKDYQTILDQCLADGCNHTDNMELTQLHWDLPAMLQLAQRDAGLPCLCQRLFPVIGYDGSVKVCHLYQANNLAPDYLRTSLDVLLAERRDTSFCRLCQTQALHRLDVDVLERRHRLRLLPESAG